MPDKASPIRFDARVTASGKEVDGFTSLFASNADASEAISSDPNASDFALDLVRDNKKWGDSLSGARSFWLHKVASDGPAPPPAPPLAGSEHLVPAGGDRVLIEGKVISKKWKANGFAPAPRFRGGWSSGADETLKILISLPDGNRVWGTCPAPLVEAVEGGETSVRLTAKVKPSDKDENFGFFSFPKVA
jgi:hypothetical protein